MSKRNTTGVRQRNTKEGIIYYLDYRDEKGCRIRETIGPNKSEAIAAIQARKTDIMRGEFNFKREGKLAFSKIADEYLEDSKVTKRSWTRDQTSIKVLKKAFGSTYLSKITVEDVERYKTNRRRAVGPASVNTRTIRPGRVSSRARKRASDAETSAPSASCTAACSPCAMPT